MTLRKWCTSKNTLALWCHDAHCFFLGSCQLLLCLSELQRSLTDYTCFIDIMLGSRSASIRRASNAPPRSQTILNVRPCFEVPSLSRVSVRLCFEIPFILEMFYSTLLRSPLYSRDVLDLKQLQSHSIED